jgi:xylan 1,4-beta-xylosidase
VQLSIEGVPVGSATLTHYRVDQEHGNAFEVWKRLGSPPQPTPAQYAQLEQASQLAQLGAARQVSAVNGRVTETFTLPRQGVSLLKLTW